MTVISGLLMWGVVIFPIGDYLPAASSAALDIDYIFRFMAFFGVPILVYVNGYIIYFAWRYHTRKGDDPMAVGSNVHDYPPLEIGWTVIPTILMIVLAIISYVVLPRYYLASAASVATIEAIGHTFYYEFRYPGLKNSVLNEMHLPVGKQVTIDLTSSEVNVQKAVIHSFWAPEFRVKQDMIPGMIVPIHFTPTIKGTYRIICTEFCGLGHSNMIGKVVVESQADFDKWFAQQKGQVANGTVPAVVLSKGDAAHGATLFAAKCTACHSAGPFSERKVGPGLGEVLHDPNHPNLVNDKPATPENVAGILENGASGDMGTMPNMQVNQLTAADVADLVAYLESLHK
jgi:cytochrome c oxidase subunit II